MKAVFVAGAHTDVGKTHVACALIRAAREAGLSVDAVKPVVSGFDPADWTASDPGRLLEALGREPDLEAISPWRFTAALAPPQAAALEGHTLLLEPIVRFCRERMAASQADLLVVEGVGGLMSPLAQDATGLDLMTALDLSAVLVGGSYLGAVSHTLTALEVMRAKGMDPRAVVVSEAADPQAPDFAWTLATLSRLAGPTPVLAARRDGSSAWARDLLAALPGEK